MQVPGTRLGALVLVWPAMLVVLALAASPALADTGAGHTGKVGTHSLLDTADKPGATCTYKDKNVHDVPFSLVSVRVRPPIVFARNVSSGVDQQKTGWRFSIERRVFSSAIWSPVFASGTQRASATDSSAASFTSMTGKPPLPTEAADYRVKVTTLWFRNGTTEGSAADFVGFYRRVSPDGSQVVGPPSGFCLDGLGN